MNELKVLLVEDSEKDAALVLRELRRAGYEPTHRRVETADEMKTALDAESWDVVLCDHALPEFNGRDALDLLRCRDSELPFIIVSGHIGEDLAVEAMKAGANDYIMKSNLKRLGPAIQREMREVQLRRESRQLQTELEKTEEELKVSKQVQQMKDEFLGMVSHELKSPLTVIIGALSVAVSEEIPPEEADELVRDALSSAESLGIIIDNLLELARYQKSRLSLSLQPCNVGEVVSSVVRKLQTKSPVHRLVTKIPEDIPTIPADPVRVERVLYNLVENAIKYSPEGGEVRIGLRWTKASIIVSVADQGIGISVKDQQRLFHDFERLENYQGQEIEGIGLGLRVCQVLVEAHGGRIWLESAPGAGSTFFFSLPGEAGYAGSPE